MISKLKIKNFRSIKNADLALSRITVLTGANNSGKSSIIYGILALKNTLLNPNQSIDNCLTLPFINLGGFQQTVFLKNEEANIGLGISYSSDGIDVDYDLVMGKIVSSINLSVKEPIKIDLKLEIAFPYPANKTIDYAYNFASESGIIKWNGIVPFIEGNPNYENISTKLRGIMLAFLEPAASIERVDFVPLRRGFTKPFFSPVPLQSQISSEDELATLLANDRDLAGRVAHYLEKIVDRTFSVHSIPGIGSFNLQTRDRGTGFTSDLVNEGLGTNQLVTILAKILQKSNHFICIDEPEIHLHPTIIDKLVEVLIEISEHEDKQFLISTHSEHFISSLLAKISSKAIAANDVKVYYLYKDTKETKIEGQEINAQGQIKGGLKNFYATELNNMGTFFKITD